MRKFTLILALIGMITLQSCVRETVVADPIDNDTIGEVFEYSNVNFTSANQYKVVLTYPKTIFTDDMVLVYRLSAYDNSSNVDYWRLLPETYYLPNGTLNFGYRNDFTIFDAEVELFGFDLSGLDPEFRLNQVFRVLVIPANLRNNKMANPVDLNDYNTVIDYYQIDAKNITKVNLK